VLFHQLKRTFPVVDIPKTTIFPVPTVNAITLALPVVTSKASPSVFVPLFQGNAQGAAQVVAHEPDVGETWNCESTPAKADDSAELVGKCVYPIERRWPFWPPVGLVHLIAASPPLDGVSTLQLYCDVTVLGIRAVSFS
jgi:hypothetical protein